MSDLAQALMIAIRVHADQRDKQGEPYLLHVLRIVEAVSDEAKVVAALHDACEDADLDPWSDFDMVGLSNAEQVSLELLTQSKRESYAEYVSAIAETPVLGNLAREVKLADLRDNLGRIPPRPRRGFALDVPPGSDDPPSRSEIAWEQEWGSLKARYERAIRTLEAA